MTEGNKTLPDYLRKSEQRLLCKIVALAALERGCFAKRQTLARMVSYSVHTVNSDISRLTRRGYVVVTTKGRGRDEASTIKITPSGLETASKIQAEYNHSPCSVHDGLIFLEQQQATPPTAVADPEPPKSVVSEEPPPSPVETPTSNTVEILLTAGIRETVAKKLAIKHPYKQVRAASRYISQYRGEKLNAPGMLVSALSENWKLPKWCFDSSEEKAQPKKLAPDAQSQQRVCHETDEMGKFIEERNLSPWHDVWEKALEKMDDTTNLACWVAPHNVNALRSWVYINNLDGNTVQLAAHADYMARSAKSMAAQIGVALGVENVAVRVGTGSSDAESVNGASDCFGGVIVVTERRTYQTGA